MKIQSRNIPSPASEELKIWPDNGEILGMFIRKWYRVHSKTERSDKLVLSQHIVAQWRYMATWNWVNISSVKLLPGDTLPLPESMLTDHLWGPVTFTWGRFHKRYLSHQSLKFEIPFKYLRGPCVDTILAIRPPYNLIICTKGFPTLMEYQVFGKNQTTGLLNRSLTSVACTSHALAAWRPYFWDKSMSRSMLINTLRPRQNGRHFADDIFKYIFLNENAWIPIKISLKFEPHGPINNIPALVQIMAWRRPGDKQLSGPMMVRLPTHICVTRPLWVNSLRPSDAYMR